MRVGLIEQSVYKILGSSVRVRDCLRKIENREGKLVSRR
jgi:hypothetical protein